jgi:hypothetical protein
MRTEILNYLQSQNLGLFTVSREQPWNENDVPLYLKNLKKIYVSEVSVEIVPLFATLNGLDIPSEVTSVTVYLACDAKQTPPNLSSIVNSVASAKNVSTIKGVNRRECSISRSYNNDVLITELEFRFTKLT